MMTYERKFLIQAAHFNGTAYPLRRKAYEAERTGDLKKALKLWIEICEDCHGHDFEITVKLANDDVAQAVSDVDAICLVKDEDLTALIMKWNNKNLSMLREFAKDDMRATTELISSVLQDKIKEIVVPYTRVAVQVRETPYITAGSQENRT